MEKNCVACFYVKLSDNATAIPLPENELINMARAYRNFSRGRALEVLFKLKYGTLANREEALSWFNRKTVACVDDYVSKVKNFTDEQFCLLADELCLQYQAKDPLFLDIHSIRGLPNGCQKELDMLQKKMAESPLLFFLVVKRCVKAKKNPAVSQWIIQLLSSDSIDQTSALENLGFNFNYRLCLKSFSNEIGLLLLAIHQIYVKRQKLLTSQDTLVLPLVTLLKQIIELDIQVNTYTQQDTLTKKYHHSDKVALFENDILKFIESANVTCDDQRFGIFTEYRKKLEILGKTILSLLQAQREYQKVFSEEKNDDILFAAATDIALSKKMCSVEQACKKNKVEYFLALEDFQKFLEHFEVK